MNKNNAFTLIELLGVLILLAVIALITFPIIDKTLLGAKNEAYERQKDSIIESAKLYVTENGDYNTSRTRLNFQTLKDAGFLKDGDILDPRDPSKEMPGCVIYNWDESNKQYVFEYSEDCLPSTPGECFTYEEHTIAESFDINYDECVTYLNNLDSGLLSDEIDLYCKGESVYGSTMKDIIQDGYLNINDLKSNNVITNIVGISGIEITGYDNTCGGMNVILPKSIDGKDIISIGIEAFGEQPGLTINDKNNENYFLISDSYLPNFFMNSIDMSNAIGLINIGIAAFSNNSISSVILPNNLKLINEYAFYGTGLTNIIIPNKVTIIEEKAFDYSQLMSVTIGDSVEKIGSSAFSNNQLTSITISNSVKEIGFSAFENNQLTSVTIPNGIIEI